jgi:hypothetical protein
VYLVNTFTLQYKANVLNPIYGTYFKERLNVPYRLLLLTLGSFFRVISYSLSQLLRLLLLFIETTKPIIAMRCQEEWTQTP